MAHPAAALPHQAALIRIRRARNEWRYYRLEIWPDLFGRPSLPATGAASAPKATTAPTPTPAIALGGFSSFTGLAAGQVQSGLSVMLQTAQAGAFIQTITLDPTGSNASGYAGALAPEVLTVTGTVDGGPVLATGSLAIGQGQSENVTELLNRLITPGELGDSETIVAASGNAVLTNGVVTYTAPAAGMVIAWSDAVRSRCAGYVRDPIREIGGARIETMRWKRSAPTARRSPRGSGGQSVGC